MSRKIIFFAFLAAFAFDLSGAAQSLPTAIPQTKWASGQDVVPYFEGWIRNADGSFDMVFGYFNRNWEEQLVIPPGPDNRVEPGGPDREQPTVFAPRRQSWVYRVRVPKDFGTQVVTWTIKANGKTNTAYGELMPVEEITERIIMTRGNLNPGDDDPNRPPIVTVSPPEHAAAGTPITVTALVKDDGLPKPRPVVTRTASAGDATKIQAQANSSTGQRPRGLNVSWMQLRGPARAEFDSAGPTLVSDGKAPMPVKFPKPGTYVLRATANDGALSTRADVTVTVGPIAPPEQSGAPGVSRAAIDNERVTVWDVTSSQAAPAPPHDSVWVTVAPQPGAAYHKAGETGGAPGARTIVIDLKAAAAPKYDNTSGFPSAFPRPGVKKILENDRVVVWDYTWTPNEPTAMHFHDKDVVVVFLQEGALKSTTPDGQSSTNELTPGQVQFNRGNRVHTEVLVKGSSRAIITELK